LKGNVFSTTEVDKLDLLMPGMKLNDEAPVIPHLIQAETKNNH
jgi:hypothetical protein